MDKATQYQSMRAAWCRLVARRTHFALRAESLERLRFGAGLAGMGGRGAGWEIRLSSLTDRLWALVADADNALEDMAPGLNALRDEADAEIAAAAESLRGMQMKLAA